MGKPSELAKALYRLQQAKRGVQYLRLARAALGASPAACNYTRRALKSAEGAVRHANRLVGEAQRDNSK